MSGIRVDSSGINSYARMRRASAPYARRAKYRFRACLGTGDGIPFSDPPLWEWSMVGTGF